jgi:hypothetical protein
VHEEAINLLPLLSLSANFLANFSDLSDKKENGMCGGERRRRRKSKKFQYQKRGTTFGRGGMSCRRFPTR